MQVRSTRQGKLQLRSRAGGVWFVQPWDKSQGGQEERSLVLGVRAEVSEKIEARTPFTACKGIWECMAVGGSKRADA